MEFVNQAGFSSGTCAVGGGAVCAGSCQFGALPCSLSPCPPNAGADSPTNLTWLAAPCSNAPPAADPASRLGGASWYPPGGPACLYHPFFAPALFVEQIALYCSSVPPS